MKKYDAQDCAVLNTKRLTPDVFSLTVSAGEFSRSAKPGQFAQLLVPGKTLRRPISFCEIDAAKETLRFVFQAKGEGTRWLAALKPGDTLNVLAPLGSGFDLGDTTERRAVFVGGGVGVPPLLAAAKPFGRNAVAAVGFRSAEQVILQEEFEAAGAEFLVATDDGSRGHHGLVTELLDDLEFDVIFTCGPLPMLRAVAALAAQRKIPCQVSLEERMACGIGACLGCAVKLRSASGEYYGHVCKDGPVFDAASVVF